MKIDPTRLYMVIYTVAMTAFFTIFIIGTPILVIGMIVKLIKWILQ